MKRQAYIFIIILSLFAGKVSGQCTVTLTSAGGTDSQTKCINTAIADITYNSADATGASASGLPAGVTGTWAAPVFTISGMPTESGTFNYTVTLTGAGGCLASGAIIVSAQPTATAGGSQTICQNGTATVSSATSSNGTILWTHNGAGSITAGSTTLTPTYSAAAGDAGNTVTLTMTVSNSPCAAATATYSVIVKGTPTATAGSSQSICQNGTATVSGATASNGTILWTHNGAGSITAGSTTLTPTYTAAGGDAGNTVTLTLTVSNSPCADATATYTIIVKGTPTAIAGGSQTICQNGTATVSGATSSNGTILWTHNGTGSITGGSTTLTPTYTAAAGDAGNTVTLTMTVSNSPCLDATATYSVIVKASPTAIAGGSQTICQNGTATVSGATSSNGTILWTEDGAGSITSGSTTLTPTYTSAAGDAGNTVTLTMTISNSPCSNATATYTVIVNPTSVGGTVSSAQTICHNTSPADLTLAGNTGNVIRWEKSSDNGFSPLTIIAVTSTTLTGATIGNLTDDTWFRAVVQSGVCSTVNSSSVKITVHHTLTASISGGSSPVCYNTSPGTLTASASGGGSSYIYQWYNTITGLISGATNATYNPGNIIATTGYYCAITSSECGTATNTSTTTITVRPQITLTGASQASQICSGLSATINLSGLLAGSTSIVDYSINGVGQTPVSGVVANGSGAATFSTGTLAAVNNGKILQITGISTGSSPTCSAAFTQNTTLIVNSATIPTITGNATPCINSTGNVYITEGGMTGYTWNVSAGGAITAGGTGTNNTVTVTWNSAGTQNVSVNYTNVNGCTSGTATIKAVTVSPLPNPTISGPASVCSNSTGNVYTTEAGMPSYTWTVSSGGTITAGGTGNIIIVTWSAAGAESVSVNYTNNSGCSAASATSKPITVNALPVPTLSGPASPRITSTGNVYTTESGMSNYVWTVSGGGTKTVGGTSVSNTVTVTWNTTGPQSVSVSYTNTNSCTATTPTVNNLTVNPLPVASSVTIAGTAALGNLLTGNYSYTDGGGGTQGASTFRWLRNGTTVISGATSITYTPVSADLDKTLTFEVTPVSLAGPPNAGTPVQSAASDPVEDLSGLPVADQVCIEGIRAGGNIIKGKYRYTYTKSEGTSTYRWLRNGFAIGGATGIQYTLQQAADIDSKAEITFEVTPVSTNKVPRTGAPVVSNPLARITLPQDEYSVAVSEVVLTANQSGGVFSGPGVTDGKFSPSSAGIAGSPYTIQYFLNIVNSSVTCSQQASQVVTVVTNTTEFGSFNAVYCANGGTDRIIVTGLPNGATPYMPYGFYINSPYYKVGIVSEELSPVPYIDGTTPQWAVTIDPGIMKVGDGLDVLNLWYYYLGYYYLLQKPFNIESVAAVTRITNLKPAYCEGDAVQNITVDGLTPTGGTAIWTGGILTDKNQLTAKLDPALGTPGQSYPITYQYKTLNNCYSNIFPATVKINPLPDPTFTLNPTYNIDGGAVTLVPSLAPGGAFVGNGVSGNKLFPDIAGLGEHEITYTITDANSCTDNLALKTTIRKAQGNFLDIPALICYRDTTFNARVTGLPAGVTVVDFINKKNSIVHTPGATTGLYNVPAAGSGLDTLIFSYKWSGVDYSISTVINIDSIGQVTIQNLQAGDVICNNVAPFELFTSLKGGVFAGPVTGGYLDPTKALGNTNVLYKYTSLKTGCTSSIDVPVTIIAAPVISFVPADYCVETGSDSTRFINNTPSIGIYEWQWEFADAGGAKTSNKQEPAYLYKTGGLHPVTLTAKTTSNCSVTKTISIDLGVKPVADFYWKNECYHPGESLQLFDTTFSTSAVTARTWNFFDGGPLLTGMKPTYPKAAAGYQKVEYIVKTNYANCSDTVTKNIYIRPSVSLTADSYFQNFENGNGGWVKNEDSNNSWSFGKPDRTVINTASSGDNAWFTRYAMANQKTESSSIISPCFDFTASDRPMISLKLWRRFDTDRDGAALQYKVKDEKNWHYVGTLNDGINWFNSAVIKGKPGGDPLGWSLKETAWTESRHTLDVLKNQKDVKFRIAYGSDGTSANNDGIAFDDIWIGERTRKVLLEHFANTSSTASKDATAIVNKIAASKDEDVINIQYHTNFPGSDPFYNLNPADESARILFYGLTKAPYSYIDGGYSVTDFAKPVDYSIAPIDSNDVTRRSLKNPSFEIKLTSNVSGSILSVSGQIKALEDLSSDNLTLYLAVTQKKNTSETAANGETIFLNVFRKFIPDAGGIGLKKTWVKGDIVNLTDKTWIIEKTLNASDIEVIAFVQNSVTKEIFQASSEIKKNLLVGIETLLQGKGGDFALYPNPATDRITIAFKDRLNTDADIRIYDIRGLVVANFKAGSGLSEFTIENPGLRGGIYLIRISSGGIDFGFKKLIISGD